jgi:hypothetical protein
MGVEHTWRSVWRRPVDPIHSAGSVYFDAFASSYEHIYGRVAAIAALMIWLYTTNATALIGAEINSEIERPRKGVGRSHPYAKGQPDMKGVRKPPVKPDCRCILHQRTCQSEVR